MRAIGKYIILTTLKQEEIKSLSGLLLSSDDVNGMRYTNAKVKVIGDDVNTIQEGDEVYYDKSNSFRMLIEGEEVIIIQERDVVVVV